MTTVIHLTKGIEYLSNEVKNWSEVPSNVKEYLLNGTDFKHNGQELIIYEGRKIIASCTIDLDYYDNIIINDCWTDQGNIFE